ncbi:CAF17-like 4Fe-4S cluster assembly/insertion protein YgfZ [Fuscibacter oryzae]|uniref:Folate-binding protein YgfZ n=1 Tax=Fuscibacter oryzae TaxID=2803939 RepID=A0A8J7MP38_9RHOB|nr:folate-binding protein YgfZ [Fuscibacter oryzae]MBL4927807.1 folate-binding protein YgfZ [Fuscibacter oryzae]
MSVETTPETAPDRRIYRLTGADALPFLQGLVSNDVMPLAKADGVVWAALLTPQGKYLADFFVVARAGELLLDISDKLAEATVRRLSMYRLRADVQITPAPDLHVTRGMGTPPAGALPDPRHPALGWRAWGNAGTAPVIDWDAIRVEHLIPETGIELLPDDSYLLEAGFERLNGVNFRKGCYVGQEVTARMKHKTELRKGLVRLRIDGAAPVGTEILSGGKPAGILFTQSGGRALAHMRHDRMDGPLTAGSARLFADG